MHFTAKISFKPCDGLGLKTFSVACCLTFVILHPLFAQFEEDFADGNITSDPTWIGPTEHFTINAQSQLQLNAQAAGTSWLSASLAIPAAHESVWEFWIRQPFSPSGANFARVYLMSDQADLTQPLNGYYLQFGEAGSEDAVELFRQSGSSRQSVCRASDGSIAASFAIRVKVVRSAEGSWQLYTDYSGATSFSLEASGHDATHNESSYFGLVCNYTISNVTNFYFDDIAVRTNLPPDTNPPHIDSVRAISLNTLLVTFSEPIEKLTAGNVSHYRVSSTGHHPHAAALADDQRSVTLSFAESFENGYQEILTVRDVADLSGNALISAEIEFLVFIPFPVVDSDVIMTEILADPEPSAGLPAHEFVELFNRSAHPVQLSGWGFTDGTSTGIFPEHLLHAGHHVIVCAPAGFETYKQWGQTVALKNFPTLNNAGDKLMLIDANGVAVDSLQYATGWYRDEDKAAGGWTLERIDPENACLQEENWIASVNLAGGTPGFRNSVFQITPDTTGPILLGAELLSEMLFRISVNERLADPLPPTAGFVMQPDAGIHSVAFEDETRKAILVEVTSPIAPDVSYRISVESLYDCPGNPIDPAHSHIVLNPDLTVPFVVTAKSVSDVELAITFSEKVMAGDVSNYALSLSGQPAAVREMDDGQRIVLSFKEAFPNGWTQELSVSGVVDLAGNAMTPVILPFRYFVSSPIAFRDIRITEIMADPSPVVGLPEGEYVEIYNRSAYPVNVNDWVITDGATVGRLKDEILLPREFLILCASSLSEAFAPFGKVLAMSPFPSLNNPGDVVYIVDASGQTIDSVRYNISWYHDSEKMDGGWSLELIDPDNVCEEDQNWTGADDPRGGTPGEKNSVDASKPDNLGPKFLSAAPENDSTLLLQFNERLHKDGPAPSQFLLSPQLGVQSATFADHSGTRLSLRLSERIAPGTTYTITAMDVFDCPGNRIREDFSTVSFILPEEAETGDVVVNEILFNPRPNGVDFIEVYNRSAKTIDLRNWSVRNDAASGTRMKKEIASETHLLNPHSYRVFTADNEILANEYVMGVRENFWQMDLPAFNDDAGFVVLIDGNGKVIDSVSYTEEMHTPFLKDPEGVSLERINPLTEESVFNWRSGSSVSGFATPGYRNSNARDAVTLSTESVIIEPEIIQAATPGHDFARISFTFEQPGYMANVSIVDAGGRIIRRIAEGELLGAEGFLRWDGEDDDGFPVGLGYYLVWFEIFNDVGRIRTFKKRIVIY